MRPCQQCGAAMELRVNVCPVCDSEQISTLGGKMESRSKANSVAGRVDSTRPEDKLEQGNWFLIKLIISTCFAIVIAAMAIAILVGGWEVMAFVGASVAMGLIGLIFVIVRICY